jgi:amidohydrolase family protein
MRTLVAIALLACATVANAQDVLIRGATVHTIGDQGVLNDADVLVRDGKIAAVGSGLSAPSGVTTVEAKGRVLTPGLFAGLTAIGIEEVSLEPTTVDSGVTLNAPAFELAWRPEFDVTNAYNPRSVLVPVAQVEGLTWTMLTPAGGEGGALLTGQGGAVTLDGRYDAVLAGTRALFITLGGDANILSAGSRAGQWMLLDQAIRETRSPSSQDEHLLLHPLGREALAKYLNGGRVVFDVNRAADIRRAIAFAKRNGMKPIIAGGAEAWIVADELARDKVPVLLDALVNLPYNFDDIGARLDNAALLDKAGVRIAFTQFNESHNARKIRQLAGNAVAHGLPKEAAIAALTVQPAEIFGVAAERGRIARGQVADLVLWSGDPLEVTSAADQVWIGGRAVEMRSRQTELRDRYLKRLQ